MPGSASGGERSGWLTVLTQDAHPHSSSYATTRLIRRQLRLGKNFTTLRDQAQLASLPAGMTRAGSDASTTDRAELDAEFTRWLMGYPAAWGQLEAGRSSGMPMPSSRS